MKYKAHDYQQYATDFIIGHPVSCLILDMGLGKTVITLTALWLLLFDYFEVRRILVIAPKRVAETTWPAEIKKWEHLYGMTFAVAMGTAGQRKEALLSGADVTIIGRDNVSWMTKNIFFDFDMVVIDELSSFKSPKAQRFKDLKKVRPMAKRVVGLTGTPGNLMDLWAEIGILDMGQRLGRYIGGYRDRFFLPDKRNREIIFSYKPREGAEEKIYELISDISISMKAVDYLDMPECINNRVTVSMSESEQALYDRMADEMILEYGEGQDIDAVNAAALSNKLQQMANGAVYDESGNVHNIHDRKLDALEDLIESANGKPLLVAYWFKHDRERMGIRKDIEIDGQMVAFKASAAIPRIYRLKFQRDIYKDLALLEKSIGDGKEESSNLDMFSLEMFENIAFIMAKHADPSIPDTPEEWLDNFNTFSIYQVLPQLIELWGLNIKTDVEAKKNFVQQSVK